MQDRLTKASAWSVSLDVTKCAACGLDHKALRFTSTAGGPLKAVCPATTKTLKIVGTKP